MAAACNYSIPDGQCTLETCCLEQSHFSYIPSFGGDLFFVIYFAVAIIPQLGLAWSHRTWGFAVAVITGLVIEIVGYIGRLILHHNPFNDHGFLMYLICVTIAPVFISAGIYLSLSRIVILYGEHLSYFRPRTIAVSFMTSDFTSLVLQAAGGGITDAANDSSSKQSGIDIMIAGLLLQVVSLVIFLTYMAYFAMRCRTGVLDTAPQKSARRRSLVFQIFLVNVTVAVLAILIRSIFRVAELWEGFDGSLWNNQTDFFVLDGAMVAFAVLLLTVSHPGIAFGDQWHACNWSFKSESSKMGSEWTAQDGTKLATVE